MAILINDTTPRVQYTATSGQTVFSVPFEFFSNSDLVVYQNTTLKTLTTHYTVTGAGVTGGGSITLVTGATAGDVITIIRDIPVKRITDFPSSGPFNIEALNSDLDRLTAMIREREDQASRVISLAATDAAVNLYLPTAVNRASKVMGFDSTGNVIVAQELGQYRGNWASGTAYVLRDIIKDTSNANIYICVAAHTSTGSQPISTNTDSAKWGLLVDAASSASSASAAAASASAASTSATNAASSASSASSSASTATTQASNASTSASNASTSATNAASSASSAATSASNASTSASSAASSAALAAAAVAGGLYSAVIDKSANYTVVLGDAGDLIRVTTTSGAVTITLPQISTVMDGFKVAIVKWTGDANAVTIARSGSDTINGATSTNIGSQYTQITFVADFETNQWFAATSGLGSTNVVADVFSGTGSQTAFTLSGDAGSKNNTYVYVSGVYQQKSTYSLSTTTLTFSTAPPSGSNNVEVIWTQPLPVGTPSDGTVTAAKMAAGAAVGNLGYTPVNKAGDTLTGALNGALSVTLASASTVNIGAAGSNTINISGTTTITAFDTIAAGATRRLVFAGVLTLTHNATSLILPSAASITTAAGDVAEFVSLGSGNWRCFNYMKADGSSVSSAGIGVGQTWQNVTASRALGTTYTNTTNKPIGVIVSATTLNTTSFSATVAGVIVGYNAGTGTTAFANKSLTFIVPAGATYSAQASTGSPTLGTWAELR